MDISNAIEAVAIQNQPSMIQRSDDALPALKPLPPPPGDVRTRLFYLAPLDEYEHTKPYYVNWPVHDIPGAKQTNLSFKGYEDICIHDTRKELHKLSLDRNGFELRQHSTSLSNEDFEEDTVIRMQYYPEIEKLLKKSLGASRVFIFEHTHRVHVPETTGCSGSRKRRPLVAAHIDQTPASAAKRLKYHMKEEAADLLSHRYQIVNIWRPLFGPLYDYPLTLGDFQTFDLERDSVPTDLVFPHYIGESCNLRYNANHKWYYVSEQCRDEVWLFKCFDSDKSVAHAAPHCSFDLQAGEYLQRPRESIEIRALVFY